MARPRPRDSAPLDSRALRARLDAVGRARFACLPTPLLPAPALASRLGSGVRLLIKADAWTGLGLGGNKVRKLEFELAPERLEGVTDLVTAGGPHSNHCRVTAAAAARLGLGCSLVVDGAPEDPGRGNALLHRLFGARIVTVGEAAERTAAMEEEARRIAAAGGRALTIPVGASTPRGALGYVLAAAELRDQLAALGHAVGEESGEKEPVWIFLSASSGGTLAGLVAGCALLGWRPRTVGVSAGEPAAALASTAAALARGAVRLLESASGADPAPLLAAVAEAAADMRTTDEFAGAGYGAPTARGQRAIELFGRRAGVILDPVYTAKAAAATVAWIREGRAPRGATVVFLHTGGHPALFR